MEPCADGPRRSPDLRSDRSDVPGRGRRRRRLLAAAVSTLLLLLLPAAAVGQDRETADEDIPAAVDAGDDGGRRWWNAWSGPSSHDRLYLGLWSAHTFESDFPDFFSNRALGLQYSSLFGVSFVNSYGDRSLAVGAERSWLRWSAGPLHTMLGFRAGLIYGYDEKLVSVAGLTPVLPLLQPVAMLRFGAFGADVGWVPRVMSITGGFFF